MSVRDFGFTDFRSAQCEVAPPKASLPNNPTFPFLNFVQKDTILLSEIFQAGSKTGSLNRERLEFVPNESVREAFLLGWDAFVVTANRPPPNSRSRFVFPLWRISIDSAPLGWR
jgi:hypothetical protein